MNLGHLNQAWLAGEWRVSLDFWRCLMWEWDLITFMRVVMCVCIVKPLKEKIRTRLWLYVIYFNLTRLYMVCIGLYSSMCLRIISRRFSSMTTVHSLSSSLGRTGLWQTSMDLKWGYFLFTIWMILNDMRNSNLLLQPKPKPSFIFFFLNHDCFMV
jgi:hypothetical protein